MSESLFSVFDVCLIRGVVLIPVFMGVVDGVVDDVETGDVLADDAGV